MFDNIVVVPVHSETYYVAVEGQELGLISRFYVDGEITAWSCSVHGSGQTCDHITAFGLQRLKTALNLKVLDAPRQEELRRKATFLSDYQAS